MLPLLGEICTPEQAQNIAVQEALRGAGCVAPNPLVGCAIVSQEGRLLSTGYHARLGEAHAEVHAFDQRPGYNFSGATLYVTLEPCSHQGRTPPCADRIIKEKIAKAVVAVQDPNPLVAGKGLQKMRDAGIEVVLDAAFAAKSMRVAEHFLWNMTHKIPFITLKLAMSLDGKMALKSGESAWITSEASRKYARTLRAHHDATLIGAQTLLMDNPILDFRETSFAGSKSNRILIWDPKDKTKTFLPTSHLAKTHSLKNIQVLRELNMQTLSHLYQQGITSIFVEGGPQTLSQLIKNKLFNKMYVFVAPVLLGNGRGWSESLELSSMADRLGLEFAQFTSIDKDILVTAYPR